MNEGGRLLIRHRSDSIDATVQPFTKYLLLTQWHGHHGGTLRHGNKFL